VVFASLQTLLAFAFVLGVLIFVHELGHFLMARWVGIRVIRFSLGFPPRLFGIERGGTDYCVGVIPLGGYVTMAGDNPDQPRTGRDDEFLSKSRWQRFLVLMMGPVMNILLAIVLMAVVLSRGAEVPVFQSRAPVVGVVVDGSPAARAGVLAGDRIVSVAGRDVTTWETFFLTISARAGRETPIVLLRDGREFSVSVTPASETRFELGDIGVLPDAHPRIASVVPGRPAEQAGLKPGDIVLALDGRVVTFASQLSQAIARKANVPVTLTIERSGARQEVRVTPALNGAIGMIGIGISDETVTVQPGPVGAIGMSFRRNYEYAGLILDTLWGLVTRQTSPRQLMGPVAIAQLSGESAQAGWLALFSLMASISLNLGLLNLLPVPVLDGGHIFIMAIEGLARRDFSTRVKEKMLLTGFVLLMMLMVTVIYNDLTRIPWLGRLLQWR
jgi:regulator of sigma E protease